jgi:hypothetical protein
VGKRLSAKDIHKEMLPVDGEKCLSPKVVHDWVANFLLMTKTLKWRCGKWLRRQSKDFYAAGFDALIKRRDKCINVRGGYVEKKMFFIPRSNITCFTFYIHF